MASVSIAIYLGESYATLGLFNSKYQQVFEKSVFLPQTSLKNLLINTFEQLPEYNLESDNVKFYIVTKYLDRLKSFRLGGSVTQIVEKGFENSYVAIDTPSLSLAAASLVIPVRPDDLNQQHFDQELQRIRKINPDLNKVVIQLPEERFKKSHLDWVNNYFEENNFKIFNCSQPHNLAEVRKVLLDAGTEGTKEEIITDIQELFGDSTQIFFWSNDGFLDSYHNHTLFQSASSFLAEMTRLKHHQLVFYFDHESFRLIQTTPIPTWQSPWGEIPTLSFDKKDLKPHPYNEVKLNEYSLMSIADIPSQHEPGPICAGRGIKPLVIDLFFDKLKKYTLTKNLFPQLESEQIETKLSNILSVLEKGQANSDLQTNREELIEIIQNQILFEIEKASIKNKVYVTGPLARLFFKLAPEFHWPTEIMKMVQLKEN